MAFMAKNRSLSYCKVIEVVAETTAPLTPMGELLGQIPSQHVEIKPLKASLYHFLPGQNEAIYLFSIFHKDESESLKPSLFMENSGIYCYMLRGNHSYSPNIDFAFQNYELTVYM